MSNQGSGLGPCAEPRVQGRRPCDTRSGILNLVHRGPTAIVGFVDRSPKEEHASWHAT
jgi:hypothetical protein